jgi:hypothetical protein
MIRQLMVAGLLAAAAVPAEAAAPDSAAGELPRRPRPTATAPT